jgi:hypothetical protein
MPPALETFRAGIQRRNVGERCENTEILVLQISKDALYRMGWNVHTRLKIDIPPNKTNACGYTAVIRKVGPAVRGYRVSRAPTKSARYQTRIPLPFGTTPCPLGNLDVENRGSTLIVRIPPERVSRKRLGTAQRQFDFAHTEAQL